MPDHRTFICLDLGGGGFSSQRGMSQYNSLSHSANCETTLKQLPILSVADPGAPEAWPPAPVKTSQKMAPATGCKFRESSGTPLGQISGSATVLLMRYINTILYKYIRLTFTLESGPIFVTLTMEGTVGIVQIIVDTFSPITITHFVCKLRTSFVRTIEI